MWVQFGGTGEHQGFRSASGISRQKEGFGNDG